MKKLLLVSLLAIAMGSALGAEGDSTKVDATVVPASTTEEVQGVTTEEGLSNLKGSVESLTESFLETKSTVDKLAKIKVSGYVQAQWQYADSNGIRSIAGGNFATNSQERFQVRRGRLKTTYETLTSKYVLQFDVIPSGLSIKDAYATITEPWLKTVSYTMGVFDRPFGFEIGYSSSSRESPERARVYQVLFPGERDLGAKVEVNPAPEMGVLGMFNLKAGVFTGMGPTANENDNNKDFIGRVGFAVPLYDLNLAMDGGFSVYMGSVTNVNDTAFSIVTSGDTTKFKRSLGNALKNFDREIMGVDAQIYYDVPVIGGMSIRGEYLWGKVPTYASASTPTGNSFIYLGTPSANPPILPAASLALYEREVMGLYVNYVQNVGTLFQLMVKYDAFDPNTEVKGSDIGISGSSLTAADILHETLGLGAIYHWDESTKFVAYYDIVSNEKVSSATASTSSLAPYKKDLNDNVFTFRMQVKF